jgi:hypothetical protein
VKKCFAAEPVDTTRLPPKYIFTATCDTSWNGGHMSIVSGYFSNIGDLVIIGLDSKPVGSDHGAYCLLHRHYEKLFTNKNFRDATRQIFIPEKNLGLDATHLADMLADLPKIETFCENGQRPGVYYNRKKIGRDYQYLLEFCLAQRGLHFDKHLFTSDNDYHRALLDKLNDQMLMLHWEKLSMNYVLVHNFPSDLLLTLQMVLYWGKCFIKQL